MLSMKVEYVYDFNMSEQPIGQTKQHNAKANDERDDSAEQSKSQPHLSDDLNATNFYQPLGEGASSLVAALLPLRRRSRSDRGRPAAAYAKIVVKNYDFGLHDRVSPRFMTGFCGFPQLRWILSFLRLLLT